MKQSKRFYLVGLGLFFCLRPGCLIARAFVCKYISWPSTSDSIMLHAWYCSRSAMLLDGAMPSTFRVISRRGKASFTISKQPECTVSFPSYCIQTCALFGHVFTDVCITEPALRFAYLKRPCGGVCCCPFINALSTIEWCILSAGMSDFVRTRIHTRVMLRKVKLGPKSRSGSTSSRISRASSKFFNMTD